MEESYIRSLCHATSQLSGELHENNAWRNEMNNNTVIDSID